MDRDSRPRLASPADVEAYRRGVPERAAEFGFLIGRWQVETIRYGDDGREQLRHDARWEAEWLFGGRVLFDRFVGLAPDGAEIGAAATLRTFCEQTGRWEMTFLHAGRANWLRSFTGEWVGDEMRLEARGEDALGRRVEAHVRFHDIEADAFRWEQRSRLEAAETWFLDARMNASRIP